MENNLPLISVIIPTYNSEVTVEDALRSVLTQDYPRIELLVIDGRSSDRTCEIVANYQNEIDFFSSEVDEGIADALNKGITQASGEWLYFLGSDDVIYDHNVFRSIFSLSACRSADMVYGDVLLKNRGSRYDGKFTAGRLIKQDICHQAQFFKRRLFDQFGLLNTEYKYASDWAFNIKIFSDQSLRIVYIDRVTAVFNDSGRTASNFDVQFWKDAECLFSSLSNYLSKREIYTGLYPFLYYLLEKGSISSGLLLLMKMIYHTKNLNFAKASVIKLIKRYF